MKVAKPRGAVTVHGLKQKVNSANYLHFVVHYVDQSKSSSSIRSRVLLIQRLKGGASSAGMQYLRVPHIFSLKSMECSTLMKRFTLVTDCGGSMPGIVSNSVCYR